MPHLEGCRAAEDVLRAGGVLHAGQLHDDAVRALLLDDGLGHAQLVDAVAQDGDVLRDRAVLDALLRLGLEPGDQRSSPPASPTSRTARSGNAFSISTSRLVALGVSRKRSTTFWPSRPTPVYWMLFSRIRERMSVVKRSAALSSAPFMSTCSRKCTPPRRSRPRYIGSAPIDESQAASARAGSARRCSPRRTATAARPCALSWVSGSAKRTLTPVASPCAAIGDVGGLERVRPRRQRRSSIFTVAFDADTCTAGTSAKKFGSV